MDTLDQWHVRKSTVKGVPELLGLELVNMV